MDKQEFQSLLAQVWPGLSSESVVSISRFRDWVVDENSRQNLTTLTSPQDFVDGHVMDVKMLLESEMLCYPCLDLGSGAGVPGFLTALIHPAKWVLSDSEGHKAAFLQRATLEFGLQQRVTVFSGRAEEYLSERHGPVDVKTVVARAVGPVTRIYSWIRACSTWNSLVLLKGPRWDEEWAEFEAGRYGGELELVRSTQYSVGAEEKKRIIVRLERVPRGTPKIKIRKAAKT